MNDTLLTIEEQVATAFGNQAADFDRLYGTDRIILYKRKRVREHAAQIWSPRSSILELNAGTGEDALYFVKQGHTVHATDIAGPMQDILTTKVKEEQLEQFISTEICSFTELENLQHPGPYDCIFSNFAGLNCTGQLSKVLDSFHHLVKPGGFVTLVVLPRFCLWEFLLLFRGKFKTAFRRFSGSKGAAAKIGMDHFRCWYYNPSFIRKQLGSSFDLIRTEGLCTLVPPSYLEEFEDKYPRLFSFLEKKENRWKSYWPWKVMGDYYIITLQKKH